MKVAVVFGQFGAAADPVNLPHFRDRIAQAGHETILVEHTDSQKVFDFKPDAMVGASLGAGAVVIFAQYIKQLTGRTIQFLGGFQPSAWDPSMQKPSEGPPYVVVPSNVKIALCFRNPIWALTGGLGYATWIKTAENVVTKLQVIEREDLHPGDFGPAQDQMFNALQEAL